MRQKIAVKFDFSQERDAGIVGKDPVAAGVQLKVPSDKCVRLLIFLPAILIPACISSSPAFLMMYSAYTIQSMKFSRSEERRVGKECKQCQTLFWGAPKSLQMVTAAMKLKDAYCLEGKL